MSYNIHDYELQNILDNAKSQRDPDAMVKALEMWEKHKAIQTAEQQMQMQFPPTPQPWHEPEKLSWEQDLQKNRKVVTINVQIMVENLLGGRDPNKDVQVVLERYGDVYANPNHHLQFVVVNICDLKTGNIITLREKYSAFPSPEFLTKLELLRVGKSDGV